MPIKFKEFTRNSTTGTGAYVFREYTALSRLSTPQNVAFTEPSSASWDEVENATHYEVVLDSASWGDFVPVSYKYSVQGDTLTLTDAPYTQDGDTVTIE